jgi:hypothetical protein
LAKLYVYNLPLNCRFLIFVVSWWAQDADLSPPSKKSQSKEVRMANWRAFIEDDEGSTCVYLQDGDDKSSCALFEIAEADIVDELEGQVDDYWADAEEKARDRNGKL